MRAARVLPVLLLAALAAWLAWPDGGARGPAASMEATSTADREPSLRASPGVRPTARRESPPRGNAAPEAADGAQADTVRVRVTGVPWTPVRTRTAQLYLVPKDALGLDDRYPSYLYPVEGAPGCFDLPREALAGHHLCSHVQAALTGSLDGDGIGEAPAVELPIEPAPVTTIEVEGVPEALRGRLALVARSLPRGARPLHHVPGPGADAALPWWQYALDGSARLVAAFPTRARVGLRATLAGYVADPLELDVGNAGGAFTIRMRPSAVLTVAPRGLPGRGWFHATVRRHAEPHEVKVIYGEQADVEPWVDGRPAQVQATDLGPGGYTVTVKAEHHRDVVQEIEIRRYGERVLLEPLMQPSVTLGSLEIQAALPPGHAPQDPKHTDFFEFQLRRAGEAGWYTPLDVTMAWQTQELSCPALPTGRYELLLWERGAVHVAYVPDVRIAAGETTRLRVTLEAGRMFTLQPLADAGLKTGVKTSHGIALRSPSLGALPFYFWRFLGESLVDCCGGFEKVSVGPFPVQRLFAAWGQGEARREVELPADR